MQISSKTEYALRTLLDLAQHSTGNPVPISDIASRQNIPVKFLEQILLTLKSAGLTSSRRGPKGGYALAKPADEITIADIVEATEARSTRARKAAADCPFEELWTRIRRSMDAELQGATIADMQKRARELAGTPGQHYSI